jgi:SmpA / OmlA family
MFPISISKVAAIAALAGAILLAGCAGVSSQGFRSARSDAQFAQVQRGMTRDDVLRLLGPPDETMKFPLTQTQSMDYRYQDIWGYLAVFSAVLDADGQVSSTLSWRVNVGGDHASR